ncbi:hypothetical protein BKA69DRAFT_687227 [Paraphysoderma sedebokerense]|nr:hypothetical protein BKA69DRAFT_687227 [Paraphysoderma sedebokerense]
MLILVHVIGLILICLFGAAVSPNPETVSPSAAAETIRTTDSTSNIQQDFDVIAALDSFYTPSCNLPRARNSKDKPIIRCSKKGVLNQNDLKNLQFLGFHGTVVAHVKSLEKEIQVGSSQFQGGSKHGPGFYFSDSLSASRLYSTVVHQHCRLRVDSTSSTKPLQLRKLLERSCEPAMCAIFGSKSFWLETPKVYMRGYHKFRDGSVKQLYWNPENTKEAVEEYMIEKGVTTPIMFSPLGGEFSTEMQGVFSSEHVKHVVAVCSYDSQGSKIAKKYGMKFREYIPWLPISEEDELEETFAKLFGERFKDMVKFSYRDLMRNSLSDNTVSFDVIGIPN